MVIQEGEVLNEQIIDFLRPFKTIVTSNSPNRKTPFEEVSLSDVGIQEETDVEEENNSIDFLYSKDLDSVQGLLGQLLFDVLFLVRNCPF